MRAFLTLVPRQAGAWAFCWLAVLSLTSADPAPPASDARVARWKDDRKGTFLLMFDDSWPSHWQVAAPELVRRGLVGTFYICPGKGEHQKFAAQWEKTLWPEGMVYGDHTMTHRGVKDLANAEVEIGECARVIRRMTGAREDRLVSYGQPGVEAKDWKITGPELAALLARHHLISRPPFANHGAVYHLQTLEQMLALADKAIQTGGLEYLVIHGVERIKPDWGFQDMWPLKQTVFLPLLDALKERSERGDLWITDHISAHQYETERETSQVAVTKKPGGALEINLTSGADPKFYDLPLTLVVSVAANWQQVSVSQGHRQATVSVRNGKAYCEVVPNGPLVTVQRAPAG